MNDCGHTSLRHCVRVRLQRYFKSLEGCATVGLYRRVLDEVEWAMLEEVMAQTAGNQTRAARLLGVNRNTLRQKLARFAAAEEGTAETKRRPARDAAKVARAARAQTE